MLDESTRVSPLNSLGNALKRLRPDDELSLDNCSRSPKFWHDEGTIILRVDDALFRVHRDLLSTHFAVFKDVFAIPQPADPEKLDGCQVMVQSGDRREDWETALTFMYSPLDLHPWYNKLKVQELLSLVRLAHKYQGEKLLTECINRLKAEFPTDIVRFQKLYPACRAVLVVDGRTPLAKNVEDLILLINNALELEIECILPCAYYLLLMKFQPEEIVGPTLDADGRKTVLSPTAQQALFLGSSQIFPALLRSFERWMNPGPTHWRVWCRQQYDDAYLGEDEIPELPDCRQDFEAVRSRIIAYLYDHRRSKLLLLASCKPGEFYSALFDGLCHFCKSKEGEYREIHQLEFWLNLPRAFGVGKSWRDLKYY